MASFVLITLVILVGILVVGGFVANRAGGHR